MEHPRDIFEELDGVSLDDQEKIRTSSVYPVLIEA